MVSATYLDRTNIYINRDANTREKYTQISGYVLKREIQEAHASRIGGANSLPTTASPGKENCFNLLLIHISSCIGRYAQDYFLVLP